MQRIESTIVRRRFAMLITGLGVAGILCVAAGCDQPKNVSSEQLYQQGLTAYHNKQYEAARDAFTQAIARPSGNVKQEEAYYMRGLCYRALAHTFEHDKAAIDDFENAAKLTSNKTLRGLAELGLAHTYFEQNTGAGYRQAATYYERALDHCRHTIPQDLVLYRLGVSLQCAGKWPEADRHLKRCSEKYSKTHYGQAAAKRLGATMFRIQTGAFSEMDGAIRQTALLKQAGHQADWETVRQKTGTHYLVRMGRYTSFSEAAAALAGLKNTYHDAYLVTAASVGY